MNHSLLTSAATAHQITQYEITHTMKRILLTALALAASLSFTHAGSHTWSGAANGYWNNDANWSSGGKPVAGETNVALFFPLAASRVVVTNNIPGLKISAIALNGDYTLHGSGGATLDFAGANAGITVNGARTNLIASSLPIVLDDSLLFHFSNAAGHLKVYGVMSGEGGVTKNNAGTLTFGGMLPNTYAGTTLVRSGTLVLDKSAGFPATGRVSEVKQRSPLGSRRKLRRRRLASRSHTVHRRRGCNPRATLSLQNPKRRVRTSRSHIPPSALPISVPE